MPSSVGRSRMPHNNRVSGSAALRTNDMWSKTIGYNPYAGEDEAQQKSAQESASAEQAAGIMLLAKMSNLSGSDAIRGACKKCNMVGHLTFQCRNTLYSPKGNESSSDSSDSSDDDDEEDIKGKGMEQEKSLKRGRSPLHRDEDYESSDRSRERTKRSPDSSRRDLRSPVRSEATRGDAKRDKKRHKDRQRKQEKKEKKTKKNKKKDRKRKEGK